MVTFLVNEHHSIKMLLIYSLLLFNKNISIAKFIIIYLKQDLFKTTVQQNGNIRILDLYFKQNNLNRQHL